MTKLSVVIGTYNQKESLEKTLLGFNDQDCDLSEFEVIVVDSSSTDGSDTVLKTLQSTVSYTLRYYIQENTGKVGARNRGVAEAKSELIMITDGDMIPDSKLIGMHIDAHNNISQDATFEGRTFNMRTLEWPTKPENLYPLVPDRYKNMKKLGFFYFLTGNISFKKSLFEANNGFDVDFQGYGWEDLEMGYRLFSKNIPHYYLKDAINYHYHVVEGFQGVDREYHKGVSAAVFLKKHPELKWFLGYHPLSRAVKALVKEEGLVYRFFSKVCCQSSIKPLNNVGYWFLGEYHYQKGLQAKLAEL